MRIGTNGILVDGMGEVLLIQRDDTRTFAPPGGGLEAGELPTEGVVRELREETGLIVMPVRLVAVVFSKKEPESNLFFLFRCLQRGGDLATSEESLSVGFYPVHALPRPMTRLHRERLEWSLQRQEPTPFWIEQPFNNLEKVGMAVMRHIVYPMKDRRRARRGEAPYVAAPSWETGAFVILQNDEGQVLWVKRTDKDLWNLPGGGSEGNEPPWQTAVRETLEETGLHIKLTKLSSVNVYHEQSHMVFNFLADIERGTLVTGPEAADFAWFTPGSEPHNSIGQHVERVADAFSIGEEPVFRLQSDKIDET